MYFKFEGWLADAREIYVLTRLRFSEDGDLEITTGLMFYSETISPIMDVIPSDKDC